MMLRTITALIAICLISFPSWAAGNIYVAPADATPAGNDENSGTAEAPLATIAHAIAHITDSNGGWNIILRGGTYQEHNIQVPDAATGTSEAWNTMQSYPGEWAIIDGQRQCTGNTAGIIENLDGFPHTTADLGGRTPAQYWKFRRLELTGGGSTAPDTCGSGIWWVKGPFTVEYCYFHDNLTPDQNENSQGLGGMCWQYATVKYNYFINNGSVNHEGGNSVAGPCYESNWEYSSTIDFDWEGHDNEIAYNYIVSDGDVGIRTKASGKYTSTRDGTDTTYQTRGDRIHHNIVLGTGFEAGIRYETDYAQVYNNIVTVSATTERYCGITVTRILQAGNVNTLWPCVYNNTIIGGAQGITRNYKYVSGNDSTWYCYNNILDSQAGDWARPPLSMNDEYDTLPADYSLATANPVIDRNYFYRNTMANGKRIAIGWDQADGSYYYTPTQYEAAKSGVNLFNRDTEDAGDTMFTGTTGASQYITRSAHIVEDSTTIASGGIGGPHPYLSGVTIPSYIGAVNPSDSDWVAGVLALDATYMTSAEAGSDPAWIEGDGGEDPPVSGARSTASGTAGWR